MIDLQTPLRGPVDVTKVTIMQQFIGGQYSDEIVSQFADSVLTRCAEFGFRASILCAQIAKETGFFRFGGDVPASAFNLAGLGATGGGVAGLRYANIDEGVCAVLAHHCTYMYGDIGNWPARLRQYLPLDQRHDAVMSTGRGGSVSTIGSYVNGWWAYSPQYPVGSLANGYATGIAAIADRFTTGGTPSMADYPTEADIGCPVRIETTDFVGADRALADIQWFVVHDTEGHYEGDIAVLTHGSRSGSVHAIIGREPGQFCASVPIRTTAWTAGNDTLGALAVQVELSKAPQSGEVGYTDTQYRYLAAFFRWCVAQGMTSVGTRYYWPHPPDADGGPLPDVPGIIGHYGVPDGAGGWGGFAHHTDPGPDFDWDRLVALIEGAPPAPVDTRVNGHVLAGGFRALWEATPDRMRVMGYPVSEEYDALLGTLPVTVQDFERVQMLYDVSTPDPFRVRVPLRTEKIKRAAKVAKK